MDHYPKAESVFLNKSRLSTYVYIYWTEHQLIGSANTYGK